MKVIKKDGTLQEYNEQKIVDAVGKAALRARVKLTDEDYASICNKVLELIDEEDTWDDGFEDDVISVFDMHSIVENALKELFPKVAHNYIEYRNYKIDFVSMLDECYVKEQEQRYIGDKSNANTDSTMVSTQRSLSYGIFSKALYRKFFLTKEEYEAIVDGYIYINDEKDRRDTMNCCIFDIVNVLTGGFEMGNIWYEEPNSLDTAFDVISDITLSAASQQYGGFTLPEIDKVLAPYAEKTYKAAKEKYLRLGIAEDKAEQEAIADVEREFEQGFQGWEYKFNTVASSRGDYPFIAMSLGLGTDKWSKIATQIALKVRMNGQGKKGKKKPVLFPKITFLYDKNLHDEGKMLEESFEIAIDCSRKTMYPDYLSLTGEGYIPSIYKKYGKVISLMGCRASLSPWFERGGMHPADDDDTPVFVGRFNIGVVSLHLPMILAKARQENKDFYEVLDYYLNLIRQLHIRTYNFLGEKKASTNPIGYTQGGFLGGNLNPNDKIKPLLKSATASFGITALNELQRLYNGKSIYEDGEFPLEVMEYINKEVDRFKEEDGNLYAIYGTPAESLSGTQVQQFRAKYGIVEGVSDREYVSNSFHCHVTEDITPIEKQNAEARFWDYFNGGKIQYWKNQAPYNRTAAKVLIRRAMEMGFYEGMNLSLSFCDNCGHEELSMDICPKCGSTNITQYERMNGYVGYKKVQGDTRFNDSKMAEFAERKSM